MLPSYSTLTKSSGHSGPDLKLCLGRGGIRDDRARATLAIFYAKTRMGVERNDVAARLCCLPSRQARMPARSILPPIMIVAAYFPQAAQKIKIPEKFLRRIVSPAIDSAKGKSA